MREAPFHSRPSRKRPATRPLFVKVRVSEEEKVQFESLAHDSGVTLSDFIRKRLAGVRIYPAHIGLERNRQLARIGNNLNQIARWANMRKSALEAVTIISALESLRREIKALAIVTPEGNVDAG